MLCPRRVIRWGVVPDPWKCAMLKRVVEVYEHKTEPLLPLRRFIRRQIIHILLGLGIIGVSLGLGIAGYHILGRLSWIDSLVNASMILGGMGPVNPVQTTAGKVFASFYALFSGMVLLVAVGVLIAPVFHRFLHRFHLEIEKGA